MSTKHKHRHKRRHHRHYYIHLNCFCHTCSYVFKRIKEDGSYIRYVINQTPEFCLFVIQQSVERFVNIEILKYCKWQTNEICLSAVKKCGFALQYVKKQSTEICLEALKQNWSVLHHVKKRTPELYLSASRLNIYRMIIEGVTIPKSMLNAVASLIITDVCIAMKRLKLPSYVLLEIINWMLDKNTLTEFQKINQIIRINEKRIKN